MSNMIVEPPRIVQLEHAVIGYTSESTGVPRDRIEYHEWVRLDTDRLVRGIKMILDSNTIERTNFVKVLVPPFGAVASLKWFVSQVIDSLPILRRWISWRFWPSEITLALREETKLLCPHGGHKPDVHRFWLAGEACYEGSPAEWRRLRKIAGRIPGMDYHEY